VSCRDDGRAQVANAAPPTLCAERAGRTLAQQLHSCMTFLGTGWHVQAQGWQMHMLNAAGWPAAERLRNPCNWTNMRASCSAPRQAYEAWLSIQEQGAAVRDAGERLGCLPTVIITAL